MANTFSEHFEFAMSSVGLPVPKSLFGGATTAAAAIKTLSSIVATYGTKVTVAEAILAVPAGSGAAAVLVQVGTVAGACTVAFYVGACIGALAYATGQWTSENLWADGSTAMIQQDVAAKYGIPISDDLKAYLRSQGMGSFQWKVAEARRISSRTTAIA